MGCSWKCLLVILVPFVAITGYIHHSLTSVPELPKIDLDEWWGAGAPKKADLSIRPFKVQFTDEMIDDLKNRLSTINTTPPLEGVNFEYGLNSNYLKEVIKFWNKDYNFKERETFLNHYPHFKTNIQGLDIHYIHVKPKVSKNTKVLPLLLLHGWPGSIREFYGMIPLLTTPRTDKDFVFEVIVPSIPGYGFSQAAAKPGFGADKAAILFRNLMQRLGHNEYYIQGGDWGGLIVELMATLFPIEVKAVHSNIIFVNSGLALLKWALGTIYSPIFVEDKYKDRMYPLGEKFEFILEEFGYMHLQATKPDTVGVALSDSPAGLAAYILEKFSTWTNPDFKKLPDGGITKKFTLTDILDNIMIYWSTQTITTSMRFYAETMNKRYESHVFSRQPVSVPAAYACFKNELGYFSESIVKDKYLNLIQMTHYEDGGHFAAFELPQVLADDVWMFISKVRNIQSAKKSKKNEL